MFAAEEAGVELGLDKVIFVPSGTPPHKSYECMATPKERYEMVLLAVSSSYSEAARFEISRLEMDRKGTSYTLDTLLEIKKIYMNSEIYFILGMDAILDIMSWHEPLRIAETAKLVVIDRPGYSREKIDTLPDAVRDSTIVIGSLHLDISGTDLRRRIRERKSVRFLLPDLVYGYIRMNNLYLSGR